jgi:hypothetical protein
MREAIEAEIKSHGAAAEKLVTKHEAFAAADQAWSAELQIGQGNGVTTVATVREIGRSRSTASRGRAGSD